MRLHVFRDGDLGRERGSLLNPRKGMFPLSRSGRDSTFFCVFSILDSFVFHMLEEKSSEKGKEESWIVQFNSVLDWAGRKKENGSLSSLERD